MNGPEVGGENARAVAPRRSDFEALLIEEGPRSLIRTHSAPIDNVWVTQRDMDRAMRVPVSPWVLGECCDHIYPTCPHVVRTGRLDANDGKWRLGIYRTVDDPHNPMYLDPEWDNPDGDVCGWCFRVWSARQRKAAVA